MLANLTGEKRTVKSFTCTFIPPFIPFSHLAKHKASRWESGSLCLWLLLFVSKVTGFIPLGTAGTALEGETRTKCTTLPQHVDVPLKECGTECETLQSILRSAFTRNWSTVFSSGRVTLNHHFKHLPSLCNKLSLIYSSVNATASARHLRLWSSNSNQIWRLLRCICIISPAFMNCQLPIMGSSWKADRKWQLWKKCGYWCLSGRVASFQRTIRVKLWGKELRLSLSSWQFTTWKSVNWTNVKKPCAWIGSLGDHKSHRSTLAALYFSQKAFCSLMLAATVLQFVIMNTKWVPPELFVNFTVISRLFLRLNETTGTHNEEFPLYLTSSSSSS